MTTVEESFKLTAKRIGTPAPWVGLKARVGNLVLLNNTARSPLLYLVGVNELLLLSTNKTKLSMAVLPKRELKTGRVDGKKYAPSLLEVPAERIIKWSKSLTKPTLLKDIRVFGQIDLPNWPWEKNVSAAMKKAKDAYYNSGNPVMTDAEYDYLHDRLTIVNPEHPILSAVGAKVKGNHVKLPAYMGSLTKVKNGTNAATQFISTVRKQDKTAQVLLSAKMDGTSALLQYNGGRLVAAFSRGESTIGQPILPLIRLVRDVPATIKNKGVVLVRGELMMPNSVFAAKFEDYYANPRNLVSGQVNAKKSINKEAAKQIRFVAHAVMKSKNTPVKDMADLKAMGFTVVSHRIVDAGKTVGDEGLFKQLQSWKNASDYEMDGVVVTVSSKKLEYNEEGDPEYSRAWKDNSQSFKATVGAVDWNLSKHGLWKPRVQLAKGVKHMGVTITYASAHNASYVKENGIGPGAVIEMIRSGDVIPYVVRVIKKVKPQLPKGKWSWTSSGVDIVADGESSVVVAKQIVHFLSTIGVEGVKLGIVSKLVEAGFDTIPAVCAATVKGIVDAVDGVQTSTATKIVSGIRKKLKGIDLPLLADASLAFGRSFGSERLYWLWSEWGNDMMNWKGMSKADIVEEITAIEGFGVVLARQFAQNVGNFVRFFNSLKKKVPIKLNKYVEKKASSNKLEGQSFVFSGFRDTAIETRIEDAGGEIGSGVSKNTTILVVKDKNSSFSKMQKAKQLGVKVMSAQEFAKWMATKKV